MSLDNPILILAEEYGWLIFVILLFSYSFWKPLDTLNRVWLRFCIYGFFVYAIWATIVTRLIWERTYEQRSASPLFFILVVVPLCRYLAQKYVKERSQRQAPHRTESQ